MNTITRKFLAVLISSLLIGTICLASDKTKEAKKPPELADVVVGVYYGDIVSDSKGSSRSDVTVTVLKEGTGGTLKAGAGLLESAGRAGNLYEHTAGLALDIYRNSKNPAQRRQAHNLIRFFIRNRRTLGWRNMFYESWGFGSSGKVGGAPNHNDHIHIDWMDFSLLKFEGSNKLDRSKWTEITWPPEARVRTGIDTPENAKQVKEAWDDTAASFLTDTEIAGLYR